MVRPWTWHVDRFCHQYLQLEPELDFPPAEILRLAEVQDAICTRLFADHVVPFGPPERYRARTLKDLVMRIEAAIDDWDEHVSAMAGPLRRHAHVGDAPLSDRLVSALSVLLCAPLPSEAAAAQSKCHVTYHLSLLARRSSPGNGAEASAEPRVTLLEKRSLVSEAGTTGLRTWEAALHLGQYLCLNPHLVAGKRILELGAGTGYLSILCAKYLSSTHAMASDGSDHVINNLDDNFSLNHLQGSPRISPIKVQWGHALGGEQWTMGCQAIDVVLGADITYDRGVIPALVGTLVQLFELHPRVDVYISATQRNKQTLRAFWDCCQEKHLDVEEVQFAVPPREAQGGPFYNDEVAIQICRVSSKATI